MSDEARPAVRRDPARGIVAGVCAGFGARLGIDPLSDGLDADTLRGLLAGRRTRMKPLLLDQHVIAGIGNIYADEILHAARLHPEREARSLRRPEIVALHAP